MKMVAMAKGMKYTVIIGGITLLLTIVTAFAGLQQTGNNWRFNQSQQINSVERKISVLDERVCTLEDIAEKQNDQINNLQDMSSDLKGQFKTITEILSRLDKRTARLEEYFFKNPNKQEK